MQGRTYYRSATETALNIGPLGGPYSHVVDHPGPLPVLVGRKLVAPHSAENDAWMTHPADVDYLEPDARWCRVCTLPNSHPVHSQS